MGDVNQAERRLPTVIVRRRNLIKDFISIKPSTKVLEVGALDIPTYTKHECCIKYLDYYDDAEFENFLNERRIKKESQNIVNIDYCVKSKRFSKEINDRFNLVIANHVIEHVPDVITWINEIDKILSPGGMVFLAIPDRRFTLDYLRRDSNIVDFMKSLDADLVKPDLYQILDFLYFKRNITPKDIIDGSVDQKLVEKSYSIQNALKRAQSILDNDKSVHANVHCNVFSFTSFAKLWGDLLANNLVSLKIFKAVDVWEGSNEFHILLSKSEEASDSEERKKTLLDNKPMRNRKVICGKNNYLFLDNDTNHVIKQVSGELPLSDKDLFAWQILLEMRSALLKARSSRYLFVCAPNKECVYPELLPEGITLSDNRAVCQILNALVKKPVASFIYPLEDLVKKKKEEFPVYPRSDTHWSYFGAYICYLSICKELNLQILQDDRLIFDWHTRFGDLQRHAAENEPERVPCPQVRDEQGMKIFDNQKANRGNLQIFEHQNKELPSAIVFRDSFTEYLIPYLKESFRRLVLVWNPFVDYALVEEERPDLVLNVMAERFLLQVPDDIHGFGHEEIARIQSSRSHIKVDN